VAAAVALADTQGLGAVSMRSVASALGTAAPTLYRYLTSREDLLDLMTDAVVAELRPHPAPAPDGDGWLGSMLTLGRAQLALHRRHPWLLDLAGRTSGVGPEGLAWFDACLRALEPLDAPSRAKLEAVAVMTGLVVLVARAEQAPAASPFAGRDLSAYPHLVAALTSPPTPAPEEDLFDRALRSLLVGLLTPGPADP
jgi:AcrR family transcriptional regulator